MIRMAGVSWTRPNLDPVSRSGGQGCNECQNGVFELRESFVTPVVGDAPLHPHNNRSIR